MGKIIVTTFTDPMMGLSYEYEPIFRKLETHFGGRIEFKYVMAGLVRDVSDFMLPQELSLPVDEGIRTYNRRLAKIYEDEEAITGMPIRMDGFRLFDTDHRSSYPLDIAYKAAQIAAHDKAYTVTGAVLCDANGAPIEAGKSKFVKLELEVHPDGITNKTYMIGPTEDGRIFHAGGTNVWYEGFGETIALSEGATLTSDGIEIDRLDIAADYQTVTPEMDKWVLDQPFVASDGIELNYASYSPAEDDKQNALIIWLHGGGEGAEYAKDTSMVLYANEADDIAEEPIQGYFGGAYVLVPQAGTMWMDDGTPDGDSKFGPWYSTNVAPVQYEGGRVMKKVKLFLVVALLFSSLFPACASAAGVEVNANPDSLTGYTVVFSYVDDNATNVLLNGTFMFYQKDDVRLFTRGYFTKDLAGYDNRDNYLYTAQQWKRNLDLKHIGAYESYSIDMSFDQDVGAWTTNLDLPSGAYNYNYLVSYDNGANYTTIYDPENIPFVNGLGAEQTLSQVYVPYDRNCQSNEDDWSWLSTIDDEQYRGEVLYPVLGCSEVLWVSALFHRFLGHIHGVDECGSDWVGSNDALAAFFE